MEGLAAAYILFAILMIAIFVAISRWVFRINTIVDRLDKILYALDGKTAKPSSFMDGVRKGMAEK